MSIETTEYFWIYKKFWRELKTKRICDTIAYGMGEATIRSVSLRVICSCIFLTLWLPWDLAFENGVDVDGKFPGAGHDGTGVVLAVVAETFVEVSELRVPFDGGLGAGKERGAGSGPATRDMAFAFKTA